MLAVDAGSRGTADVAVVADDGEVLGPARGAGFIRTSTGPWLPWGMLASLVERAAAEAGIGVQTRMVRHLCACSRTSTCPWSNDFLEEAVAARAWAHQRSLQRHLRPLARA